MHRDFAPEQTAGCHWELGDELRESSPVYFNTFAQGYWVFTRHDAVRDIYKTPELFSSESITPWQPDPIYRFVPTQIDAPDHIKYRRIVNPWFSPRAMEAAEPAMRALCRQLVEDVAPRGECDFVTEFGLRFPTEAFLSVAGIDPADADLFVPWVEDFFSGFGGDPAGLEAMTKALDGNPRVLGRRACRAPPGRRRRARATSPRTCCTPHSTTARSRTTELLDMLTVLVLAGLDTTRATLGYIFWHLARHPEQRQRLVDEPELIPSAVEEALRFYPIVFGDGRKVTRDAEFHGVQLKQGDMVYALVAGANRDPRAYERADEFVLDRKRNNHMGFANGPHRCLGMHLARRELQIAVEEWLRVIPDFRIATDEELSERGGGAMMTLTRLPLVWDVTT